MTTPKKRPIWFGFSLGYGNSTGKTFKLLREIPEVTKMHVSDGSFDGNFSIECYIDEGVSREAFVNELVDKVRATTENGQLADDYYSYEGELGGISPGSYDVWETVVRPAPTG